jgi:quercetin dioxygenase-like cupin family protein
MTQGHFISAEGVVRDQLDWGQMAWFSRPADTGTDAFVLIEVTLLPGFGHDFHKHPDQAETIYVMEGQIEQWLDTRSQVLTPGDAVFIPAGVVHASFSTGSVPAKLMVVLGPAAGEGGYELVDMSTEAPWNGLRR